MTSRVGGVCGTDNCTSKKYRLYDGHWYCSNGHLQQGIVEIGQDEDDYAYAGRNITKQRIHERILPRAKKDSDEFMGFRGYTLYLQSIQILLRHQVEFLVKTHNCPPVLEWNVRNLWIRYLDETRIIHKPSTNNDNTQLSSSSSSSSSSDDDDSYLDEYLSGSSNESIYEPQQEESEEMIIAKRLADRRNKRHQSSNPNLYKKVPLIFLVALCYLGCRQLNLPIYISDLHMWIENYHMPYMNGVKYLPIEMKRHLAREYCVMMEPRKTPIPGALHAAVQKLSDMLSIDNTTLIPGPLLLRQIAMLSVPLQLYPAVLQLSHILHVNYSIGSSRKRTISSKYWAEVQLMAILVICIKLYISTDDDSNKEWKTLVENCKSLGSATPDELVNRDINEWTNKDIDFYMDWFQTTYPIDESKTTADANKKRRLLNMFPLDEMTQTTTTNTTTINRWRDIICPLRKNPDTTNKLTIYKPSIPQIPSTTLQVLIEAASNISCVDSNHLRKCIYKFEVECKKKNATLKP